jgi:hypothetical protein
VSPAEANAGPTETAVVAALSASAAITALSMVIPKG